MIAGISELQTENAGIAVMRPTPTKTAAQANFSATACSAAEIADITVWKLGVARKAATVNIPMTVAE